MPDTVNEKGKLTQEGEEKRLLTAAGPWMQRFIIAALETGARSGELLALTWADVDLTRGELRISGDANKTGDGRRLPVSPRLRSVLEMVRHDPAGKEFPRQARVFGDPLGQPVGSIKKTWETTVLLAHGHKPLWTATKALAPNRALTCGRSTCTSMTCATRLAVGCWRLAGRYTTSSGCSATRT